MSMLSNLKNLFLELKIGVNELKMKRLIIHERVKGSFIKIVKEVFLQIHLISSRDKNRDVVKKHLYDILQ